jgi:hypothetical protein
VHISFFFTDAFVVGRFTCMMSSQLGQPLRRKSMGVCTMEQSRHARKFFDLAWPGMMAEWAVDPMVEEKSISDYVNFI